MPEIGPGSPFARWNDRVRAGAAEYETITATVDYDPLSQLLNLGRLRTEPPPVRVYLEHKVFVEGHVTKLVAGSDTGKTIYLAHLALNWSAGRSALDIEDGHPRVLARPLRVLYIDGEVGPEWWRDYLHRFAAPLELPNLGVVSFPEWAPLTTDEGAAEFWRLFDAFGPDVVILDTLSSFIDGDEDLSTTWIAFDNRITLPLKARGGHGDIRRPHRTCGCACSR
ncbi:AAA family ATPase [Nocardia takedensis]|uniref:AAA family ATPase n=1 Tax=Nocardia takedensis TaxID=259390 RepID=UPI000313C1A7|nr:AAA family ATPase [Nocardia takedensis]